MPFLSKAIIDLKDMVIKHDLGNFPFATLPKRTILKLKARTKQLVTLPVSNTDISEGYLPLIPAGPGIYLGESLAKARDGNIKIFCVNVGTREFQRNQMLKVIKDGEW